MPIDFLLERVGKERVGNTLRAAWGSDGEVLEINVVVDLRRWEVGLGIGPIPERGTEGHGGFSPSFRVVLIFPSYFNCSLLKSLLQVDCRWYTMRV